MSGDLTLPAARATRDQLAGNVEVLRRVKAFCQLPTDTHITTDLVARFYGVGIEAIKSLVKDNRVELMANGFRVLTGEELRSLKDLSSSTSKAAAIAVFPLRARLKRDPRPGGLCKVVRRVAGYPVARAMQTGDGVAWKVLAELL